MGMTYPRAVIITVFSVLALTAQAPARASVPAQTALSYLNAQRSAAGLPAGIAENQAWSQDCALHNTYEMQNGGQLTHEEDPSASGYTEGGAWAGANSILSAGSDWQSGTNPWEDAPIHLDQLFTPSLAVIGIDDTNGFVCATTWPGMTRPAVSTDTISTYPGDGVQGVRGSENANESPFVPGDFVGIPGNTTAGRELFVYLDRAGEQGPAQVTITAATLTGPNGPLEVRWVDNSTQNIGPYLTGGIILPVAPLAPGATYQATVSVQDESGTLSHTWSFTTALKSNTVKVTPNGLPNLALAPRLIRRGSRRYVVLTASPAVAGVRAKIVMRYYRQRCSPVSGCHSRLTSQIARTITLSTRWLIPIRHMTKGQRLEVTVTTPAQTIASVPYAAGYVKRQYR
jgi:hypothetical protein